MLGAPRSSGSGRAGWVDLALAEYDAHRAEVLATVQAQNSSLTVGTAAIGILAAGAFNVWEDAVLATLVFLGAVPLLTALVVLLWFSQVIGMFEVGVYLDGLERKLREELRAPAPVMTWEESIREGRAAIRRPQYDWSNYAIVGLLAALAGAALVLGAYRGFGEHPWTVAIALLEAAVLGALGAALVGELRRAREVRASEGARP
jgi:hypothetical protein